MSMVGNFLSECIFNKDIVILSIGTVIVNIFMCNLYIENIPYLTEYFLVC